jgi:hypothetical protein
LEQVWFPGAHSNVGGGYAEHGLSDVALAWISDRVEQFLELDRDYLSTRQDQRDGWGLGKIYDSAAGFFSFRRKVNRPTLQAIPGTREFTKAWLSDYRQPPLSHTSRRASRPVCDRKPWQLSVLEQELRWPAPDPMQTGRTSRASPALFDRLMQGSGDG